MVEKVDYGDIVRATSDSVNWQTGDIFKIIVTEGDGTVGLLKHSLCFKFFNGQLGKDYLYEVPWADMEMVNDDFRTISFNQQLEPLRENLASINAEIKKIEELKELYTNQHRHRAEDYIREFAEMVKD